MKSIIKVLLVSVCLMFVGCQKGCTETTPPTPETTPTTDVKPTPPTQPEVKPTPETTPTVAPTPDKEKEEEKK